MNAAGQETALTRLQSRRNKLQRELARLERQIMRAGRQVHAIEQRMARLMGSQRRAA